MLKLYTFESFFYKIVNISLKAFTDPRQIGHIRYIYSAIYKAILFHSNHLNN